MSEMMVEEFKEEHKAQYETDVNTRAALKSGFKSFKSNAVDFFLEHHDTYPLTLVIFFDTKTFDESIM